MILYYQKGNSFIIQEGWKHANNFSFSKDDYEVETICCQSTEEWIKQGYEQITKEEFIEEFAQRDLDWVELKEEVLDEIKELFHFEPKRIVEAAWRAYVPKLKDGYAALDPVTGELSSVSLGTGESLQNETKVYIYKIERNIMGNIQYDLEGDILSPDEFEEYEEKLELGIITDVDDYLTRFCSSSFNERFIEYLVWLLQNEKLDTFQIRQQLEALGY